MPGAGRIPLPVKQLVPVLVRGQDSRDRQPKEMLIQIEAAEYSIRQQPLPGAVLGRFDDHDAVLALIAHHTTATSLRRARYRCRRP